MILEQIDLFVMRFAVAWWSGFWVIASGSSYDLLISLRSCFYGFVRFAALLIDFK